MNSALPGRVSLLCAGYIKAGESMGMYTWIIVLWLTSESKLGASQIWWLSEEALFHFTIHYWTGRSNKATDALSRHPYNDEPIIESGSDCDEVEVISYSSVCEVVDTYSGTTKVPDDLKKEALSISCPIQPIIEEDAEKMKAMLNSVSVLNQVTPEDMAEERLYSQISLSICYSQGKITIISHHQDQIKGCTEIPITIWQTHILRGSSASSIHQ